MSDDHGTLRLSRLPFDYGLCLRYLGAGWCCGCHGSWCTLSLHLDVGIVDVFAKNSDGKRVHKQLEVDFVVNQGSQRYYIQVAYDMTSEEKQTQELNSLRNIPDSFKKIVIVNGTKKPWRNEEGFVIMGMKYFLLNEDSLEF